MKPVQIFAQIAKVDESKHEVWGVATAEVVDKEGEIFDYASSKPYFKAWSDAISKATDGKSLGNVREMHAPSAVGKLIAIEFHDDLKQIAVGAKIVDEEAWAKCSQGVYTGFSIGGSYVKTWKDGEFIRFTANPAEISVVDNPCVPNAHFTAVKIDGTAEVRKFHGRATAADIETSATDKEAAETLAVLEELHNCLIAIHRMAREATTGLDKLLIRRGLNKDSEQQVPEIRRGEQSMFEKKEKEHLEKAEADSASALSKLAEVEGELSTLRAEMESNNQEIQKSLTNLLALLGKLVAPAEDAPRVARTQVRTVSVRKEDDARSSSLDQEQPSVHELLKLALQSPQRASNYLR